MARTKIDSGIKWIGEIPETWNLIKLKYLFSIIGGNGFPDALQGNTEGDYPFCKVSDINGSGEYVDTAVNWISHTVAADNKFNIIPRNSILMAKIGAALAKNHRKINTIECCIDNNTQALVPRRNDSIRYLLYLTKCIDMSWFDNNSTVPSINNQKLLNFFVPDVSPDEQKYIVNYLDMECNRIDAVIEQTRASIDEYKKLKQAVITQAVTKGIRPNRPMKDSGIEWIGEICADWNLTKIKVGVTKVGSGKTPSGGADAYSEKGILFLRSQNIYDTGLVLDNPTYITANIDEEMRNTRVQPEDVLLNITGGSIGRCCIFPANLVSANVNQHVSIIRVIKSVFLPKFMHYYWLSKLGYMAIHLYQTGGNREGMTADAIKNSPILLPNIDEQQEIVDFLDSKCKEMDSLIAKKEQFLSELENYKKSLIFEYVTGKKEI